MKGKYKRGRKDKSAIRYLQGYGKGDIEVGQKEKPPPPPPPSLSLPLRSSPKGIDLIMAAP